MLLTNKERLTLKVLYPQQSNLITQTLVRDIQKKVDFTQEELIKINLRPGPSMEGKPPSLVWDDEKLVPKEIEFSDAEMNALKSFVDEQDKKKQISPDTLEICLKIREYQKPKKETKQEETKEKVH